MSYAFTTLDNSKSPVENQLFGISDAGLISGIYGGLSGTPEVGFTLAPPYGQANYGVVAVPGSQYTDPFGVNDFGTVGGQNSTGLFVESGGNYTEIVNPSELAQGDEFGGGLNDTGQLVGSYEGADFADHGFIYQIATRGFSPFTIGIGGQDIFPVAINDSGVVAGYYTPANTLPHDTSFVGSPASGFTYLAGPAGTTGDVFAAGLNNQGQVVGSYYPTSNTVFPSGFIYNVATGTYLTLNDPIGIGTQIEGINNLDQIVGLYFDASGHTHSFLASIPGTVATIDNPVAGLTIDVPATYAGVDVGGANAVTLQDTLDGHATLHANGGNDLLLSTVASDTLIGGAGHDTLDGSAGTNTTFEDGGGSAVMRGGSGNDTFVGGGGNDTITTGSGSNLVNPASGNDLISLGGSDLVTAGTGNDTITGGGGNDTITTGSGSNLVNPGSGNDLISLGGSDVVTAGTGNDTIVGGGGNETITTGIGSNLVEPGSGNDLISDFGTDIVTGGAGVDTVFAFGHVLAAAGTGTLFFINGLNQASVIGGGAGSVVINAGAGGGLFAGGSGATNVILAGSGAATIFGGKGSDALFAGGTQADLLIAGSGNETLSGLGSSGNNVFYAGAGDDLLGAGAGSETFIAGHGATTVIGGSGADLYGFINGLAGGSETIEGFDAAKGDRIALQGYAAGEAATDLANAQVSGGNTVLTLSDHTQVTFVGVTSLDIGTF